MDRAVLCALETRWDDYRRALNPANQAVFDRLFERSRAHAAVSEIRNPQYLEDVVLISVLIEQQKQLEDLEDRLDHLEADLNDVV